MKITIRLNEEHDQEIIDYLESKHIELDTLNHNKVMKNIIIKAMKAEKKEGD